MLQLQPKSKTRKSFWLKFFREAYRKRDFKYKKIKYSLYFDPNCVTYVIKSFNIRDSFYGTELEKCVIEAHSKAKMQIDKLQNETNLFEYLWRFSDENSDAHKVMKEVK